MKHTLVSMIAPDIDQSLPELAKLRTEVGLPADQIIVLMVLQSKFDGRDYYTALAGGDFRDGKLLLSTTGHAAFAALRSIPSPIETIAMCQLRLGQIPLRDKIEAAFDRFPAGARICFFGDMASELDGELLPLFNVQAWTRQESGPWN